MAASVTALSDLKVLLLKEKFAHLLIVCEVRGVGRMGPLEFDADRTNKGGMISG